MITLDDLKQKVEAVKAASMFDKAKAADSMADAFLQYIASMEERIVKLEKGKT